jgi:hypothetical protein
VKLNKPKVHLIHAVETASRQPVALNAAGSLAQSYFEEPRWWLSLVLAWIAFREVEAITTSYDDIRTLHFRVVMHGANGDALMEKAPLYNLLKRLKAGRIVAIDGDDTDLPAEYWDRIGYSQPWEAWPHVRFRRDEILREFPAEPAEPLSAFPANVAVEKIAGPEEIEKIRASQASDMGRHGGVKSAETRKRKASPWRNHAAEIAARVRAEQPKAGQETVADLIMERWKLKEDHPSHRTLVRLIFELERDGTIPPRSGSRQT